jgi:hypothetical protein
LEKGAGVEAKQQLMTDIVNTRQCNSKVLNEFKIVLANNDFENAPFFEQKGGWSKFKKLFKDNFNEILIEINEAIAA